MYILYAVLQDLCLVCISIYFVNFTVLVLSYRGYRSVSGEVTVPSTTPPLKKSD